MKLEEWKAKLIPYLSELIKKYEETDPRLAVRMIGLRSIGERLYIGNLLNYLKNLYILKEYIPELAEIIRENLIS